MAESEDSEWNDAQRLHNGQSSVAEERRREVQAAEGEADDLLQQIDDADLAVFQDRVVAGEVEAEEFKDEEEEAVFEEYRQKRLQELRQQQKSERFGSIFHIDAAQFVREVTEASAAHAVIVHMFKPGLEISEKLQVRLRGSSLPLHTSPVSPAGSVRAVGRQVRRGQVCEHRVQQLHSQLSRVCAALRARLH
jgi:hypothetical protein